MNFDEMIKYVLWIAFFIIVLGGLYFSLKRMGIL